MSNNPPSTPAEALDISRTYRFKMNAVLILAKIFRFWDYPYKNAATDFAEMDWRDIYYWVHKTTNPITRPEKGERIDDMLTINNHVVGLPQSFEKQYSLTFGACGDMLYPQGNGGEASPLGIEYSKDILFENIADLLFDQTISFVNLESPITTQPLKKEVISNKGAPTECCSREQFDVLKGYKGKHFTVMNTVNNHTFDLGIEGMETTRRVLAEEGILNVGTNSNPAEFGKAEILIKDGIKIGFVSVTFGLNGHKLPAGEEYRINTSRILSKFVDAELDLLKRQINDCKNQGCDFIIGSLHWGYEFELFPRKRQVETAHTLVELGVDAIISCHPHVIQPVEYYRTKRDSNRIAVIAYSLGSLTWGYSAPYLVLSLILNLTLSKGGFQGGELTYIEKANVTPVFRSSVVSGGRMQTRIEKLADHVDGRSKNHPPEYIAEIKRYAELVLGKSDFSDKKLKDFVSIKRTKVAA